MGRVANFLPSKNGLPYSNAWAAHPDLTIATPFGTIGIGDASNGLCGGMVFAVRDLFHAARMPPESTVNPEGGSSAFRFIVRRLFDSFDLPAGAARYYLWMNLPLGSRSLLGLVPVRGLRERTLGWSMPVLRRSIERGEPCPLGLVCVRSAGLTDLGRNHQVLAYRYEERTSGATVWVYDPNHPGRDDVTITFASYPVPGQTGFGYSTDDREVLGFFPVPYSPVDPEPLFAAGADTAPQPPGVPGDPPSREAADATGVVPSIVPSIDSSAGTK